MATGSRSRRRSRISLVPAGVAFLLGVGLHAADQLLSTRAGPIPILVTAPVVATLLYLHVRDTTDRRLVALLVWGLLGSGVAVIGVYLGTVDYYLPRGLTAAEAVAYDFGMFCWFVAAAAATYVVAARATERSRRTAALLATPFVQTAWTLVMVVLVESGVYA